MSWFRQQGSSEATVIVTIETADDRVLYRTWRGKSPRQIHKVARAQYAIEFPGAHLQFGRALITYSYGAH